MLACGVLAAGVSVATLPDHTARGTVAVVPAPQPVNAAPRNAPLPPLDDILGKIRRFHPRLPERAPAPEPTGSVRPPLGAFRVAMLLNAAGPAPRVVLTCRDPAHPQSYVMGVGQADGDATLLRVDVVGSEALVAVRRGDEAHTFVAPLDRPSLAALSRILGSTQQVPVTALRPGAVAALRGDRRGAVKGVPFFEAGAVVGFRVTGVRPGSWAQDLGLCEGDVIEAIEGLVVRGDVDANALLRGHLAPSALSVRRWVGPMERRLTIERG